MRHSETLSLVYFGILIVAAWTRPVPRARRLWLTGGAAAVSALIAAGAQAPPLLRDWAPLLYILAGYYLPVLLFVRPMRRVEAWLLAWDQRLLGDPTTRFSTWPVWLVGYLDIVYTLTFMLVPAGFLTLVLASRGDRADHYWTILAGAEFGSFVFLPFLQTRPPWALEPEPVIADLPLHRASAAFVRHGTIGANTLPSGHTAGSLAIALVLLGAVPWAGALFLLLALSIAVACIVGRYHYVVDVVSGALLAVGIWAVATLFRG